MRIHLEHQQQRGLATLVVLVLISLMSILLVNNSRTLHYLKRELDLLDAQQMKKFEEPPASQVQTNSPR